MTEKKIPAFAYAPSPSLLCKLGSLIVHADEGLDPVRGHAYDLSAFRALLADPEVEDWLSEMRRMGMLPVKRT